MGVIVRSYPPWVQAILVEYVNSVALDAMCHDNHLESECANTLRV